VWATKRFFIGTGVLLAASVVMAVPELDRLPQPLAQQPLDLEALARGYASNTGPTGLETGPRLLVFISLSMPTTSLQRLFDQAEKAQAVLVLRGLANGSWRETVNRLQPLIGNRRLALQIDPLAFDRYSVDLVPTMVLQSTASAASCTRGQCSTPSQYVRIAGDVSLDYALDAMLRTAPSFTTEAEPFRRRLRPSVP
jgi:conjugal transfer pilus assembly protein TrbC